MSLKEVKTLPGGYAVEMDIKESNAWGKHFQSLPEYLEFISLNSSINILDRRVNQEVSTEEFNDVHTRLLALQSKISVLNQKMFALAEEWCLDNVKPKPIFGFTAGPK